MTDESDKGKPRLTRTMARRLGGLITHGHLHCSGAGVATRGALKRAGYIEFVLGIGYRPTDAGREAYAAYRWHKSRRENPEARFEFDDRLRIVGIHGDAREVWDWYLRGWIQGAWGERNKKK